MVKIDQWLVFLLNYHVLKIQKFHAEFQEFIIVLIFLFDHIFLQ